MRSNYRDFNALNTSKFQTNRKSNEKYINSRLSIYGQNPIN